MSSRLNSINQSIRFASSRRSSTTTEYKITSSKRHWGWCLSRISIKSFIRNTCTRRSPWPKTHNHSRIKSNPSTIAVHRCPRLNFDYYRPFIIQSFLWTLLPFLLFVSLAQDCIELVSHLVVDIVGELHLLDARVAIDGLEEENCNIAVHGVESDIIFYYQHILWH